MPNAGLGFRIRGAEDAQGKIQQFGPAALRQIRAAAKSRASQTVANMQSQMDREYTSAWATGMLARGVTYKTFVRGDGVDVKFYIQDRRGLRYVTALLGGHFKQFPVGPFLIRPIPPGKALKIPFPNSMARRFIQGEGGKLGGSRPGGAILVKEVLWGKRSGGFPRDVISEVIQQEGALFVADMEQAVQGVIVDMTS